MHSTSRIRVVFALALLSSVWQTGAADAEVLLSEFLASNSLILTDEDGEYSDWVELYNDGTEPVNLEGWALSDDFEIPNKWVFPPVVIGPRAFLVVFCSDKDRRDPEAPLHTNFKLSADGEYMALLKPDLRTATTQFFPQFRAQITDVSAGFRQDFEEALLVDDGVDGRIFIPVDDSLGLSWTELAFDDSLWLPGRTAFGFDQKARPDYAELIATDVGDRMRRINASAYVRIPFEVPDPSQFDAVRLSINYEDGFVAYLNGVEVARRNVEEGEQSWDADAGSRTPDEALAAEEIDLAGARALLVPGTNVLALHAQNDSRTSSDFFILPRLVGITIGAIHPFELRSFDQPTPGRPNGPGFLGVSELPVLSVEGGAFPGMVTVDITSPLGGEIRYSLDGSRPGRDSELYTGPLTFDGTTLLRAVAIEAGLLPSEAIEASYVILDDSIADFSSNLPLLILNTFGSQVNQTGWIGAHMQLIDLEESSGRATITAAPQYAGPVGLKIRGSSTAGRPKPSLNLELTQDFRIDPQGGGDDRAVPLLGMPEESDWILYGAYNFDHSHFRNKFIFDLSNQVGRWASRGRFVEVYLNSGNGPVGSNASHYYGIYVLFEKIKADENRVDITRVGPDDLEEPEITGGYMFKVDRLDPGDRGFSAAGKTFGWVEPKEVDVAPEQLTWLRNWLNEMHQAVRSRDPARYEEYIDVGSWIDHHILNVYPKNVDAFRLSGYFFKDREGKLEMGPIWDYDRAMGSTDGRDQDPYSWTNTGGDGGTLYFSETHFIGASLFANRPPTSGDHPWEEAYRARWRELRGGPLSTENINALIDSYAAELAEAAPRNLSRWGRQSGGPRAAEAPFNRYSAGGGQYPDEVEFTRRWLTERAAWIDSQFLPIPQFSHTGGRVEAPFDLEITHENDRGDIVYTLNGEDPRLETGEMNPEALVYTGALPIEQNVRVRARIQVEEGLWSGETAESFIFTIPTIALTELMYNPLGGRNFAFLELYNFGSEAVDLAGMALDGVTFTFEGETLAPGEYIVVVSDLEEFATRYDTSSIRVAGEYSASLSTAGEEVGLIGPILEEVFTFRYEDDWYPATDGDGRSLVLLDPASDPATWSDAAAWTASQTLNGSPGRADASQEIRGHQVPGDANQDGSFNVSDAISLLHFLFSGNGRLPCGDGTVTDAGNLALLNGNGDASLDASDVVYGLTYLFLSGAAPVQGTDCLPIVGCPDVCAP